MCRALKSPLALISRRALKYIGPSSAPHNSFDKINFLKILYLVILVIVFLGCTSNVGNSMLYEKACRPESPPNFRKIVSLSPARPWEKIEARGRPEPEKFQARHITEI